MNSHLDGAKILYLSEKGSYGTITIIQHETCKIPICFLAICKYDNDNKYYLFLCNENMEVEQDVLCDSLDEALHLSKTKSNKLINWAIVSTE